MVNYLPNAVICSCDMVIINKYARAILWDTHVYFHRRLHTCWYPRRWRCLVLISTIDSWSIRGCALHDWVSRAWMSNDRADSWFEPNQWETALLCNEVSHWVGASLKSDLNCTAHYCSVWVEITSWHENIYPGHFISTLFTSPRVFSLS